MNVNRNINCEFYFFFLSTSISGVTVLLIALATISAACEYCRLDESTSDRAAIFLQLLIFTGLTIGLISLRRILFTKSYVHYSTFSGVLCGAVCGIALLLMLWW